MPGQRISPSIGGSTRRVGIYCGRSGTSAALRRASMRVATAPTTTAGAPVTGLTTVQATIAKLVAPTGGVAVGCQRRLA